MIKKTRSPPSRHISKDTLDQMLAQEGLLAAAEAQAIKELIAEQITEIMRQKGVTKTVMARRMKTSRRQLDRLFDPNVTSVTLSTLRRAAGAVGRSLKIELV
ncbi:MAG TPA: helix-turn-helix domain-containing protein [Hyphomonas sp.]|nr:helix-turn-helix domain-containing protein [Hyphomonas sp.]